MDKPYIIRAEKCPLLIWAGHFWTESIQNAVRFMTKFEAREEQKLLERVAGVKSIITMESSENTQ